MSAEGPGWDVSEGEDASDVIAKPLIVGTYAFKINPSEQGRVSPMTHRWTCLLRDPERSDLTSFVRSVTFDLDTTFSHPQRNVWHPPFEVTEAGWGEFWIRVRVFFVDEAMAPVTIWHMLRLDPLDPVPCSSDGCVVGETYQECVFVNPSPWLAMRLLGGDTTPSEAHPLEPYFLPVEPRLGGHLRNYSLCSAFIQAESCNMMGEICRLNKEILTAMGVPGPSAPYR